MHGAHSPAIPINVQLPAHFVCVTTSTPQFSVQFEMKFIVTFVASDLKLIETFPITFYR
jgi:hypothetical protein